MNLRTTSIVLSLLGMLALSLNSYAQPQLGCINKSTARTLMTLPGQIPPDRVPKPFGVYLEAATHLNDFGGVAVPGFHAGLGVTYKNRYSAGVFYGQTLQKFPWEGSPADNFRYGAQFGGGELQYTINPDNLISVSIPLQAALGVFYRYEMEGGQVIDRSPRDFFGMVIPGVKAELNISPRVRAGIGVNYRIAALVDVIPNQVASGLGTQIVVRYRPF